jgi:hypothetical protein
MDTDLSPRPASLIQILEWRILQLRQEEDQFPCTWS